VARPAANAALEAWPPSSGDIAATADPAINFNTSRLLVFAFMDPPFHVRLQTQ
jgi:hypothetical protein